MKHSILSLTALGLIFSSTGHALPSRADSVILALTGNPAFTALLKSKIAQESHPFRSAFDAVSMEVVDWTSELRQKCSQYSKSASFVRVTLRGTGNEEYYFATPGSPDRLAPCR